MRRSLAADHGAATEPVGVVLMIAIVVTLIALLGFAIGHLNDDKVTVVRSGAKATYGVEGYYVEPTGPNDIPVAGSMLYIRLNSSSQQPIAVPLSDFSTALGGAATWGVGQRLCIVGAAAQCWAPLAASVEVTVYSRNNYVFTVQQLLAQDAPFAIDTNGGGGITVVTHVQVRVENVGTQVTCGASGPQIPVWAELTLDGGANYTPLFGGAMLTPSPPEGGGENVTLPSVPIAANLGVRANFGGGGCSAQERHSVPANSYVFVLRAGDPAPDKAPFGGQAPLAGFLAPYVNTVTKTMVLDYNQIILLFEYVDDLTGSAADYQDLVILFTLG